MNSVGGSEGNGTGGNNSGNKGGGMKGGESGKGGVAPEKDSDYVEKDVRFRSKLQAGEIIGKYSKRGSPPSGEVKKKLGKIINQSTQEAQDAMNDQGFSPDERNLVKNYFDQLRKHFTETDEASDDDSDN